EGSCPRFGRASKKRPLLDRPLCPFPFFLIYRPAGGQYQGRRIPDREREPSPSGRRAPCARRVRCPRGRSRGGRVGEGGTRGMVPRFPAVGFFLFLCGGPGHASFVRGCAWRLSRGRPDGLLGGRRFASFGPPGRGECHCQTSLD